ncbi:MAG: CFI-box-CTERM domain-containing protein [Pseudomonadota bacterium]
MPTFTEDDFADCTITGFEYSYSTQSQDENHSGTYVSYNDDYLQFCLDFYKNADDAKTNFLTYKDSHISESALVKTGECTYKVLEEDFSDTESTLIYFGKSYNCTFDEVYWAKFALLYADNYVSYGEFSVLGAAFTEQQVREILAQTKNCIMKVINSKDRKFFGNVTNFLGKELPGMVVKLTYDGKAFETTTDEKGTYRIPLEGTFGKKAQLSFLMQCYDNESGKVLFTINMDHANDTPYQFDQNFTVTDENDLKHDFVVMNDLKGTEFMGYVYFRMLQAIAVYAQEFGEEEFASKIQEVIIRPYADNRYSAYQEETNSIVISDRATVFTDYVSFFRPPELEFHEYSHHVMKSYYGQLPPAPADAIVEETNHGGYINPSTADSFVEGFAMFMAQIIREKAGFKDPGVDFLFGSLEVNTKAWDGCGVSEDMAVAGIFWDLYDGVDAADNDTVQLTLQEIWGVLKTNKANMYEVYQKFVNDFPDKKAGIDQIFINHGFFADTDEGNHTYDSSEPLRGSIVKNDYYFIDLANPIVWDNKKKGGQVLNEKETIGQATNYQRSDRYYPPPRPYEFIKTNDTYPFYKVTVTFPGYTALDYELITEVQEEGLIPVSIPPGTYAASITVEGYGEGVTTGAPLTFTNQEFISSYGITTEQGYYREHDFGIVGTAPLRPVTDPELTNPAGNKCLASNLLSKNDTRLDTLRKLRDQVLSKSAAGKKIITIYYTGSAKIIPVLDRHPNIKKAAKTLLVGMIPVVEVLIK